MINAIIGYKEPYNYKPIIIPCFVGAELGMSGSSYVQDEDIGGDTGFGGISQIQREHTTVKEVLTEDQLDQQVRGGGGVVE